MSSRTKKAENAGGAGKTGGTLGRPDAFSLGRLKAPITPINENHTSVSPPKKKKRPDLLKFGRQLRECKETYAGLSAKARGVSCHASGCLQTELSTPVLKHKQTDTTRDCTAWVRDNKQYDPYTSFNRPALICRVVSAKKNGPNVPPPLWLPTPGQTAHGVGSKKRAEGDDGLKLGAEAGEDGVDCSESHLAIGGNVPASLTDRKPWDSEHNIMFSRMNHEVQSGCREYFDKPIQREGEWVPKVREQYMMCDRQCCWNDEPAPFGETRRTLYDNVGPVDRVGCKEHQMPSYWRGVKDWRSYSSPDIHVPVLDTKKIESKTSDMQQILKTLADAPADVAREYWRNWAEAKSACARANSDALDSATATWDNRFSICWSRANAIMNSRQREYFSVPRGMQGHCVEPPRERLNPTSDDPT